MSIPSVPPRKGGPPRPIRFVYTPTANRETWIAYTAGPTWWHYCHRMDRRRGLDRTRPCVREITAGALTCAECGRKLVPVVTGWVPLYRWPDEQACVVPVDEVQRDHLDRLPTHTHVSVGREKSKGSGVWVTEHLTPTPRYSTTLPERQRDADVLPSLLQMWQDDALTQWCSASSSDSPVSLYTDAPTVTEQQALTQSTGATLIGDTLRGMLRARGLSVQPSVNGQRKGEE